MLLSVAAARADDEAQGWRATAKLSVSQLVAWGILHYAFGVCLPFMGTDLGWSEAKLGAGFSVALLVSGLAAPLVGRWIDTHGSRALMVLGALLGGGGVVLWSMASTFWVYVTAWALIGLAMASTLYEPAFATMVATFPRQSRQAIVVITLAGALASTLFLPLSSVLFRAFGWRSGLMLLAVGLVAVVVPLHASLPSGVAVRRRHPAARVSTVTPSLVALAIALMLANIVAVAVSTHVVAFLVHGGNAVEAAAAIAGVAGVAKLGGRLAMVATRWLSAKTLLAATLFLQGVGLFLPLAVPSTPALLVMIVVFGATSGARTILRPILVFEMVGATGFGANNGMLQLFTTVASSAAPLGMGLAVGVIGYDAAWAATACLAIASSVVLRSARENARDVKPVVVRATLAPDR